MCVVMMLRHRRKRERRQARQQQSGDASNIHGWKSSLRSGTDEFILVAPARGALIWVNSRGFSAGRYFTRRKRNTG
jgi:hypothetical protein